VKRNDGKKEEEERSERERKREREREKKAEEDDTKAEGENERKRMELGRMMFMERDKLCSSCNSPIILLYRQARPVLATLPAYIFVFVRSRSKERETYRRLDLGMPLRGDAS